MERLWACCSYLVMAVAVVVAGYGVVNGDTRTIIGGVFILVVAFFFNRAGWSGKGRRDQR